MTENENTSVEWFQSATQLVDARLNGQNEQRDWGNESGGSGG